MNDEEFKKICIFAPKNDQVDFLNNKILEKIISGQETVHKSIDSIICDDLNETDNFPTECLNSLTPSGMPPHELKLKVGMLLRNLNASDGQCNGSRAIIRGILSFYS